MPENNAAAAPPQSNGSSNTNSSSNNLEIAQSNQDLIMTKGKRKKRTWMIAGVVCIVVVALIVAAIVLLNSGDDEHQDGESPEVEAALNLEDILMGRINPTSFNGTWSSGNEIVFTDSIGNLILQNLGDSQNRTRRDAPRKILIPAKDPILATASDFEISADRKYLKVGHTFQKIYRYSFIGRYTVIDIATNERIELSVRDNFGLLLTVWAPVGNALAFVFDNNIYYKSGVKSEDTVQITNDSPFVYNGVPDWVYEEEVFSSNKALWFSPDGTKLAYGRFDDRETQVIVLPVYGEPGSLDFQYPRIQGVRYPKAGTKNPVVSLHFVDLDNVTDVKKLEPPTDLIPLQPILTAVTWATDEAISAIWMNRVQNRASIVTYSTVAPTFTTEIVKSLREDQGWLELFTAPIYNKNGSHMALILSQDQEGDLGGYRHLVLLARQPNAPEIALTKGPFVVTQVLSWNEERNEIFYLANTPTDSAVQHLYGVSVDGKQVRCLSCGVKSRSKQVDCLYNLADFSRDASHYVLTCAGPDVPDVSLYSLAEGKLIDWEDNEKLKDLTQKEKTPTIRRLSFEVAGGFKAQVSLKLPPNMDTSGNTKYPMLVNVYAGPDSFQVVEKFNLDWGSYLAANKSIIYATIDGRGSGLKGDKILFASYRKLGTVEIVDQINVTRQIQESLPYVDGSRTAIWGWSYGGYASGMALADDRDGVFKCAISVAPVTDWTLYDSIYTERFMGLPTIEDNYQGYRNANLMVKSAGIKDKQYFLIHGTFDDNVHYQQSMLWAKVLERNDILFRQLSYTDQDHGLASVRPHLYHSLENFLDECFVK